VFNALPSFSSQSTVFVYLLYTLMSSKTLKNILLKIKCKPAKFTSFPFSECNEWSAAPISACLCRGPRGYFRSGRCTGSEDTKMLRHNTAQCRCYRQQWRWTDTETGHFFNASIVKSSSYAKRFTPQTVSHDGLEVCHGANTAVPWLGSVTLKFLSKWKNSSQSNMYKNVLKSVLACYRLMRGD